MDYNIKKNRVQTVSLLLHEAKSNNQRLLEFHKELLSDNILNFNYNITNNVVSDLEINFILDNNIIESYKYEI